MDEKIKASFVRKKGHDLEHDLTNVGIEQHQKHSEKYKKLLKLWQSQNFEQAFTKSKKE